jgi:hypothetical protein
MTWFHLLGKWEKRQKKFRPYLERKSGGGANYFMTGLQMWSMIGIVLYFSRGFFGMFLPNPETGANMAIVYKVNGTPTPSVAPSQMVEGLGALPTSSNPTAYPTYTPFPTYTPSVDWLRGTPQPTRQAFDVRTVNFVFSYYWPPLVSKGIVDGVDFTVNCHIDNWLYSSTGKVNGCKDTTASGERWSLWELGSAYDQSYKGGIAIPYYPDTDTLLYPFGTVMHVVSPPIMAGDYVVMDICPACDDYFQSHGVIFLDFVSKGLPQDVNFWDKIEVSEVTYPY